MSQLNLTVRLSPRDALTMVSENIAADLVYEEFHPVDEHRAIGTLVFEKYYFRSKNRAALVVIADNFKGDTEVRAVSTGSSEGLLFNIDWGAADDFVGMVEEILKDYS